MKDRLKERRNQRKRRASVLPDNLSEDEKQKIIAALEAEDEADIAAETAAVLAVLGDLSDDDTNKKEKKLLNDLVGKLDLIIPFAPLSNFVQSKLVQSHWIVWKWQAGLGHLSFNQWTGFI